MSDLLAHCLGRSSAMWIVCSRAGVIREVGPDSGRYVDRSRDELVGTALFDLGPDLTREGWPEMVQRIDRHGVVEMEAKGPWGDAAQPPIRLRFEAVHGPDGEPLILTRAEPLVVGDDPVALGDQYWSRFITRFGEDGFWAYDVRSGHLVLNRQWYHRLGLAHRDVDDLARLQARIHPDDRPQITTLFGELFGGRVDRLSARVRLQHVDGHYLWIRHRAYVVGRGPDGRPLSVVGHDVDITPEVLAENRALEGELNLRRLLERVTTAVLVYGPDGSLRRWNRAAGQLLGVDPNAVPAAIAARRAVGWKIIDGSGAPIPPDEVPIFRVLRSGRAVRGQVVGVERDGQLHWGLMSAVPGFDADGALADVVCTVTDITETRKLEASLARAQRLESLGRLASGVAHDFNNLLTVVVSAAEMLGEYIDPGAPGAEEVAELKHAAQRGAELTRQLLGHARQSAPAPRTLDPGRRVRVAAGMLRRLLPVGIELVTEVPERPWGVLFDAAQFDQILVNLTVNAADAMADGGRLRIEVTHVSDAPFAVHAPLGDRVRIRVSDTGAGMSRDVLERALEPFYTTKAIGEGTGLGLATCDALVRQNGGRLRIESAPGAGTVVEIELPRHGRARASSAPPVRAPVDCGGRRVLLVDDERPVLESTRRALAGYGFEVVVARDGAEALRRIEAGVEPDVVITDVAMPDVDGPAFVRRLRRHEPWLPVLFVSGHDDPTLGRHGLDRARVDFLAKPFGPRALVERIEALLHRSKSALVPPGGDQRRRPPSMSRQRPVK